jgi:hypothetical protein
VKVLSSEFDAFAPLTLEYDYQAMLIQQNLKRVVNGDGFFCIMQ